MNLYIWWDVKAIRGHLAGMAFAYAETKDRAIELILGGSPVSLQILQELKKELTKKPPQIFTQACGFSVWGSD